ncbi:MAG TPA: hypothetical protein VMF52_16280 [Steroidobacteraceae bacterium]|nr:hypothetical protein [Steroidobacteraceae bacterium]
MSLPSGATVTERGDAVRLRLKRGTLEVVVTVPKSVREWFVEATDASSGARTEDWCDYDGYDSTSEQSRDLEMAQDVALFVEGLLGRDLRFEVGRRSRLLWNVADSWKQAVPLDASPV